MAPSEAKGTTNKESTSAVGATDVSPAREGWDRKKMKLFRFAPFYPRKTLTLHFSPHATQLASVRTGPKLLLDRFFVSL